VRAGILHERHGSDVEPLDTRAVIGADPKLTDRQKAALLDIYDSFVAAGGPSPRSSGRSRTSGAKRASSHTTSTTH
jgi:hypothetical protein